MAGAMRRSTIDLTMNVYTDPRLLDVAGALEALPVLLLGSKGKVEVQAGGWPVSSLPGPVTAEEPRNLEML